MNYFKRTILLTIELCLFLLPAKPQNIDTSGVCRLSKGTDAVFLNKEIKLKIIIDNDVPVLEEANHEEVLFLKNNSSYSSGKSIYYTEQFEKITELRAKTIVFEGTKRKSYNVNKIEDKDILMRGVFYHDEKSKNFEYPNIQAFSVGVIDFKRIITEPRLINKFYFSQRIPVLHSRYTVSFPKGVKLKWKVFNSDEVNFQKEETDNEITYTWSINNLKQLTGENEDEPERDFFVPHIAVYIEEFVNSKNEIIKNLSSTDDLYNWYATLLNKRENKNNDDLKKQTLHLIENCTNDFDKAKVIFEWVQKNINYIAFEEGWKGFIPDCAPNVFNKRYADCKGMANILVEMLRIAGLQAYHTWIGSRRLPYTYNELPTPLCDDHMIATLELNGKFYFLDATSDYVPFLLPSYYIQGKEALIGINEKEYKIIKVPAVASDLNYLKDSTIIEIKDGQLKGKAFVTISGLSKTLFASRALNEPEKDYYKLFTIQLNKGNNKIFVDSLKYNNLFEPNKVSTASYNFILKDYIRTVSNIIYINLNLSKNLQNSLIDTTKRILDKVFKCKYYNINTTMLLIPSGYKIAHLPGNTSFQDNDFGFKINYYVEGNKVSYSKEIYINTLSLSKLLFSEWNKMISRLLNAYQENLVLQKVN